MTSRLGRLAGGAAGVLALLGALEAVGRGVAGPTSLPPATEILARAAGLLGERDFPGHLLGTLVTWGAGTLLATAVAVPCGLLLGGLPRVGEAMAAVVEFLRPMPGVALFPLVGMVLGSGTTTRVVVVGYVSLWPVLVNTVYGLRDVDRVAVETMRAFGFGRTAVLCRLALPSAAPFVAAGVRLAAGIALVATVAGEIFMGTGTGLGVFVARTSMLPDTTVDVLAVTVWTALLGSVVNALLVGGERRLFFWTRS